jgi:hypothetical protein
LNRQEAKIHRESFRFQSAAEGLSREARKGMSKRICPDVVFASSLFFFAPGRFNLPLSESPIIET